MSLLVLSWQLELDIFFRQDLRKNKWRAIRIPELKFLFVETRTWNCHGRNIMWEEIINYSFETSVNSQLCWNNWTKNTRDNSTNSLRLFYWNLRLRVDMDTILSRQVAKYQNVLKCFDVHNQSYPWKIKCNQFKANIA